MGECPRCSGTLISEQDSHGCYRDCLQCGYVRDVECTRCNVRPGCRSRVRLRHIRVKLKTDADVHDLIETPW